MSQAPSGIPAPLDRLAREAARRYPSILAGRTALRAARSDIRAARHLRLPSIALEGVGFTGGSDLAARSNLAANLIVDQPVWTGGRISGTIEKAQAQQAVLADQVDETTRDVELRVVESYFQIAGAARRATILDRGIAQHRLLVDTIIRRVEQEISPRSDLDLAQSRTAQLEQQRAVNSAQRMVATQRLIQLVGRADLQLGDVPDYDPALHHPLIERLADEAVACDPTRDRLKGEAAVANAEARVAKAQIFPQLSAQFSSNEITGERVGLVLRAQTNGGLSQLSAYEGARLRHSAAILQVGVAERELREAVALDMVSNISTRARIAAGRDATRTAISVTDSYKRQFTAGRRTWLDVMNAVREAITAELSANDAEVEAMATSSRLLLRSCRWQPTVQTGRTEQ
ncbi:TolC family protein [Sphingobium sp. CFD-2]|uniref:TolC family protein n=1 Tax=Sphingobium sp. CFD-2 TaxID=2878542 RepID=UPI00214B9BEB|nr:TolC family protein [Sphingobium sp. CFD-2]